MPQLVDPRTGDVYDVADEDAEGEQKKHGLVSPDQYTAEQESPLTAAARVGTQATLALPQVVTPALAKLGLATDPNDPNLSPEAKAYYERQGAASGEFAKKAALAKEAHPIAALAGEALPYGIEGALGGGLGAGLGGGGALGAGIGLGAESALTGVSQEAVDAVTQKRDFSAKAALMNGGINFAFGGLLMSAGHTLSGGAGEALGGLAGGEARAATEGTPGARNWLSELDPGEVPEAVQGGRNRAPRTAESAGAAASNFDELPAAQAMEEIKDGKVNAGQIADAAPAIRDHLSLETENSFNAVDDIVRNDATIGAKHEDFAQGAAEWTPEIVEAQDKWVEQTSNTGLKLADELADTKYAGGLGESAKSELLKGLERVQDAGSGVERNVALDNMKRGVDRLIKRFGNMANASVDQETRQLLMTRLEGYSDELREGLKSPELFGRNGPLQEAQNKAYVSLIDPLSRVQKDVFQVTGKKFGATGMGALEQRANPDKILGIMSDPRLGGELFKRDLQASLDAAEDLARARQEHGLSKLERLPELIEHLQAIRDDMNTAQVLHVAEGVSSGHPGGASTGAALGANVLVHAAEFGGRAAGFPLGQVVRSSGAMGKVARGIDKLAGHLGFESEMAKQGTATRALLDRYAGRIKGGAALADEQRQALMPQQLKKFLEAAHAPPGPPPGTPPMGGTGTPGSQAPPGSPANDLGSEGYQRARDLIERRRAQSGAVLFENEDTFARELRRDPTSQLLRTEVTRADKTGLLSGLDESDLEKLIGVGTLPHETVPEFLGNGSSVRFITEDPFTLERWIKREPNGDLVAVHGQIKLPSDLRGQGLAKQYLRDATDVYQKLGIDKIEIPQAAEDGVVVWAKLGATGGDPEILRLAREAGLPSASLEEIARANGGDRFLRKLSEQEHRMFSGLELNVTDLKSRLSARAGEAGYVDLGARPGTGSNASLSGILTSPMALTAAGGATLLAGAKLLPDQQKARDQLDQQLQGLPSDQQQAHIQTAQSLARIQQKTEQRVKGAVTDLFALAKDPKAKPRYRSPKARELDKRSVDLDVPKHLARFMGKHDDPVDAWAEKSKLINSVVSDPSRLASHMAHNLGDLPTQQPEIFASMVGQTMATMQYLHGVMPGVSGRTALDPKGYPPTFEEISSWAGHYVGAVHPLDSLDDLASNELVPEQIDAVQSLWPEGYQMFQTAAMGQIHELSQHKGVIPREALEQIDSALNLDGAGEVTLSSAFADLLKQATKADAQKLQAEAAKPQPPMQSQSPSRLASSALGSLHGENS